MKYKETSQKELKINERFNKLIILKEDFNEKYKIRHWICKCDCGNVISLSNTDLLIYNKKSCGCATTMIDLTNKKVGKLTVIKKSKFKSAKCIKWECLCDCGETVYVRSSHLINGAIKSCGCIKRNNIIGKRFGKLIVEKLQDYKLNNVLVYQCKCDCGTVQDFRVNALIFGTTHQCIKCTKALSMSFYKIKDIDKNSERSKQQKYLYLKKFNEFLKVGIGNKRRVNSKNYVELLLLFSGTFYDVLKLESEVKEIFHNFRKEPQISFSGRTECFYLHKEKDIINYINNNYKTNNLSIVNFEDIL